MRIYKDNYGCTVVKLNESESKCTVASGLNLEQVKDSWINFLKNLFDRAIFDRCFNYETESYEMEKEENNMRNIPKQPTEPTMPKVKPVREISKEAMDAMKAMANGCPVTLLPSNNYNDKNSQGWYHVDAEDNKLGVSIHRKLWLDTLHTGGGTSVFYDENGKVWFIPISSIKFLHPYKENTNENYK